MKTTILSLFCPVLLFQCSYGQGSKYTSQDTQLVKPTHETYINMAQLPIGFYTVALVCDGQIVDTKSVFKY